MRAARPPAVAITLALSLIARREKARGSRVLYLVHAGDSARFESVGSYTLLLFLGGAFFLCALDNHVYVSLHPCYNSSYTVSLGDGYTVLHARHRHWGNIAVRLPVVASQRGEGGCHSFPQDLAGCFPPQVPQTWRNLHADLYEQSPLALKPKHTSPGHLRLREEAARTPTGCFKALDLGLSGHLSAPWAVLSQTVHEATALALPVKNVYTGLCLTGTTDDFQLPQH